jgi:hypothetical protein
MRNHSIVRGVFVVFGLAACGDDGSSGATGTGGSDTGGGGSASTNGGGGSTSTNGGGGSTSTNGGGAGGEVLNCMEVTVPKLRAFPFTFVGDVAEQLGGAPQDVLQLDLVPSTPLTGMIDLASAVNSNPDDCEACVVISVDNDAGFYFPDRGTLDLGTYVFTVDDTEAQYVMGGSLKNVRLREYSDAFEPVPNGKCLTITNMPINLMPPPATWTCELAAYDDGEVCDCECGAIDPDCAIPNAPIEGCTPNETCPADLCQ